jgi:hypothetical protein
LLHHVLPKELPGGVDIPFVQNFLNEAADNVAVILHKVVLLPPSIRDFHILAPRRCIRILLISNADRATPLMICWQPIRLSFLPAQP